MAKTSAAYYEVRWRLKDTDEAWSAPQSVNPASEVVVEGLDRTKAYEFEVRAVSSCGAKSDWVSGDHTVPDAPAGTLTLSDIKGELDSAAADAAAANAALANIASDNMLTPGEKPIVIRDYNVITTEQAGIDAQATAYGVSSQKSAYDAKVTALTTYLGTLTTPTLWNDLTGDTTIVGADFRQAFADVYTTRQALLNAIYAAAKAKTDAAQASADAVANSLPIINPNFGHGDLAGWTSDYSTWSFQQGTAGPETGTSTYAIRTGSAGQDTDTLRNLGKIKVYPGAVIKAACSIRANGANGTCSCLISWRDASNAEILVSQGNTVTGTTLAASFVVGTAPAGAVMAHIEAAAISHTTGTYTVDGFIAPQLPDSLDQVPDGSSRYGSIHNPTQQGGIYAPGQNAVANPSFALSNSPSAGFPGWTLSGSGWATGSKGATGGGKFSSYIENLCATGTAYTAIATSDPFGVDPSQVYSAQISYTLDRSYSAGDASADIEWRNSSGGVISRSARFHLTSVSTPTVTLAKLENLAPPAGTATANIRVFVENGAETGGVVYYRVSKIKFEVGPVCTPYLDDGTMYGHQLIVSGSGRRLGDMRNQVMVGVGNFGAGWSGGSISYSASSTSATISVAASTLRLGSSSLAYNASSVVVGGTGGTSRTYYLYYDDDNYTGGSKTLGVTTSQITAMSADGRVYIGSVAVTFPTSGTGSGGGNQGCPDENAWVLRADPNGLRPDWCVRAREVEVGHYLRLSDGRVGCVTYSERKASDRVRVTSRGGVLTCSTSAPLELFAEDGACVLAPKAAGRWVWARTQQCSHAATVDRVENVGPGYVQHITCENACFWTGDDSEYLFSHHNMKPAN